MSMRSPMSATAAAAAMSMLVFAVNTPEVGVVGVEVGVEVVVGVVVGVVEVGGGGVRCGIVYDIRGGVMVGYSYYGRMGCVIRGCVMKMCYQRAYHERMSHVS